MFKAIGLLVFAYTIYAVIRGEVYAKSGIRGRIISKADSPGYFWVVIAIYSGLALALVTIF